MRTLISSVLAATIVTVSLLGFAHADEYGPGNESFVKLVESMEGKSKVFQMEVLFDASEGVQKLDAKLLEKLSGVASDQAQIWGDTILEGDYEAAGSTALDQVEGIYHRKALVGYRITYSEQAWYTGDCDTESDPSRSECQEGRITESTFVAPDFKTYFRDEQAFAEFE